MSRAPAFKQSDVTRAVKGAIAAGIVVGRINVNGDCITIEAAQVASATTDLDRWRAKRTV